MRNTRRERGKRTGMTNARIINFDPNLVGFGRGDLNILDREIFAGFPGHRGLCGEKKSVGRKSM